MTETGNSTGNQTRDNTNVAKASTALPITVIGGYLGTGKTSLVNHLLRNADGLRIAVLVNEFGSLSIDEDLIVGSSDVTAGDGGISNIISIAGGCVCCSYGNDMTMALLDLLTLEPKPDHVLLEASGVALPGAIAASVSLLSGYSMDGIIVLVNAETVQEQASDNFIGDTITRQLEHADLIVLNKTDLVSDRQLRETHQWLESSQTHSKTVAKVVPAEHGQLPVPVLLQSFGPHGDLLLSKDLPKHDSGLYATCSLTIENPVDADALACALAEEHPGVLRAKGFVKTVSHNHEVELHTIQVVGRRWSVTPANENGSPSLVVIALSEGFDEKQIEALIARCAG